MNALPLSTAVPLLRTVICAAAGFGFTAVLPAQDPPPELVEEVRTMLVDPGKLSELRAARIGRPVVAFDRLVYPAGSSAEPRVVFPSAEAAHKATQLRLVIGSAEGHDLEVLMLEPSPDSPDTLVAKPLLPLSFVTDPAAEKTNLDGRLHLKPGEVFMAIYAWQDAAGASQMDMDFGLAGDPKAALPLLTIEPKIAPPRGVGPGTGVIAFRGQPGPGLISTRHLLVSPVNDAQMADVLKRTKGKVTGLGPRNEDGTFWRRVELTADRTVIPCIKQLRALAGATREMFASDLDAAAICATALELGMDGIEVALDPVAELHAPLASPEDNGEDLFSRTDAPLALTDDDMFGMQKLWAWMAMFDRDAWTVNLACIDVGFAANPDFRGYPDEILERNMETGASGTGSAQQHPFFQDMWHGNGVVTTAAGVLGNHFGIGGTGGQVAQPMLYYMGATATAFGIGTAIIRAVDDGADVINISMGYPCRIHWLWGGDNGDDICSIEGRALFMAKLITLAEGIALAACAASLAIPIAGPIICGAVIEAKTAALIAAISSLALGNTREPVEEGVAYAVAHGVPICASAGNRQSIAMQDLLGIPDQDTWTVDDWQTIPAAIPGVICVGAAAGTGGNYENAHMWGNRVDIWAPMGIPLWSPDSIEVNPVTLDPDDHEEQDAFGGTSAAAPYVAGVIADIIAANPSSFDRQLISQTNVPKLVKKIRDLLVSTAHKASDLPQDSSDPDFARRRNLINPLKAVQTAAAGVIPDVLAMGYEDDFGLEDETDDFNIILVGSSLVRERNEEVHKGDTDTWLLDFPSNPDKLYKTRVTGLIPGGPYVYQLVINGLSGALIDQGGSEHELAWDTGTYFGNPGLEVTLKVKPAGGTSDTPYKLIIDPWTAIDPPPPDPLEGPSGNNTKRTATPLGNSDGAWPWKGPVLADLFRRWYWIDTPEATIHSANDVDYYEIQKPPAWVPVTCQSGAPRLDILLETTDGEDVPDGYSVRITGKSGAVLADGPHGETLACDEYLNQWPVYVRVKYTGGGDGDLRYRLRIRWILNTDFEVPVAVNEWVPVWVKVISPVLLDKSPVISVADLQPPAGFAWRRSSDGLVADRLVYAVTVRSAGPFSALVDLAPGDAMTLELFEPGGKSLARVQSAPGGPSPLPAPVQLTTGRLTPGVYFLTLSGFHGREGFRLWLSRNAVDDGALALEDRGTPGLLLPAVHLPDLLAGGISEWAEGIDVPGAPFALHTMPAAALKFTALADREYRTEIGLGGDDWLPFGPVLSSRTGGIMEAPAPLMGDGSVRICEVSTGLPVQAGIVSALQIQFATEPGVAYDLRSGSDLVRWSRTETLTGQGFPVRRFFTPGVDGSRIFVRGARRF